MNYFRGKISYIKKYSINILKNKAKSQNLWLV